MRNSKRLRQTVSLGLVLLISQVASADWSHWRGPEQNGISRETGLVEDWSLETGENVLWVSEIGGRAAPIVINGRVYLNCRTHHDVNDPEEKIHAQEQVVCWDAATGEILWRDVFNVFQTDIPAPRVGWASMAGDPETGNVYVHTVSGIFRCYTSDGEVVWEDTFGERFGQISGYGGRIQTPIIDEDRVIVSFMAMNWGETKGPPPKQTYYAFDKNDGRLLWTSAPGSAPEDTNYSVPVVTVIDGIRMLIGGNCDGGCYAIHARTGELLWGFKLSKRGLNVSPVVDGHLVYIAHGEDDISSSQFGRVQCIDARGRGDVTETHGVWSVHGIKAGYASLLVKDDILYVVTDHGTMVALDSKTGEHLWEHDLGRVGKGSPVWADGKIYVMEVNGNVHILKPSREGCEELSHVELRDAAGTGTDEIYASPAIDDGRVFLVTRDRTICLGKKGQSPSSDPIPSLEPEVAPGNEAALLQLIPYEVDLRHGETVEYEARAYDKNGRLLETLKPTLELGEGLNNCKVTNNTLTASVEASSEAGNVFTKYSGLDAKARVRSFPELPWKWDFEGYAEREVPPTWTTAFLKLQPTQVDGTTAMRNAPGPGRPSVYVWLGPSTMTGYTIQADVMARDQRRQMSNIGITCQRYNLILKGNYSKLAVQSWAPHLRMAKEISYRFDPDKWYTLKLRVTVEDGQALVQGKVWPREEDEPAEWTIEQIDPHPNTNGSPGLYTYALAETYFDNVIVTKE